MAKKRRLIKEEPEDEYEFVPTDFDEKEFILKDIYGTKVLFLVIMISVLMGIITASICDFLDGPIDWVLCTVLVFLFVIFMKKIFMACGIRVDLLESKTLLGDYLLFLIMTLGVCIVFINLPIFG